MIKVLRDALQTTLKERWLPTIGAKVQVCIPVGCVQAAAVAIGGGGGEGGGSQTSPGQTPSRQIIPLSGHPQADTPSIPHPL